MYNLGLVLNKLMQLKRTTEGIWGQSPEPLGDFAKKIAILTPFQSLFVRFCTYMNNYNKLLELEFIKRIKLLGPFSLSYA